GDWALHRFSDAQLADSTVSGPMADPDQDRVANLVEFAMGGNPLLADSSNAALQSVSTAPGTFAFRFRERKELGDVQRVFQRSSDLVSWFVVTPMALNNVSDLGDLWVREASFPLTNGPAFYRLSFSQ